MAILQQVEDRAKTFQMHKSALPESLDPLIENDFDFHT